MFAFNKIMDQDNNNKIKIRFLSSLDKLGNWNQGYMVFLLIVLIGMIAFSGFLGYSIWRNITNGNKCKTKPSATDATITCPNQNGTNSANISTNPYYLSSEGKPIEITTFYDAVDLL
jgi:zona occludens toxin (predicted ATPase)